MACMPSNVESPRRYFGDSSQLTNWILDSGTTCHITPYISYCIPGSLMETDKYTEFTYGNFVTAKDTCYFKIKCVTTMENPSLINYIPCYWHQTYEINYFPLLR